MLDIMHELSMACKLNVQYMVMGEDGFMNEILVI